MTRLLAAGLDAGGSVAPRAPAPLPAPVTPALPAPLDVGALEKNVDELVNAHINVPHVT